MVTGPRALTANDDPPCPLTGMDATSRLQSPAKITMTRYSLDVAMRAFEERYSTAQNQLKQDTRTDITSWRLNRAFRPMPRATDFQSAVPIPEGMHPSLPVQIVATTQLALHLCKCKASPYRVRREQPGSNPMHANLYVPRIDWEFHFDALRLLTTECSTFPSVLQRANTLHPATRALISISTDIHERDLMPPFPSYEERQVLDPEQSQRNLLAKRMSDWYALPDNERASKDWTTKHSTFEKDFLNEWTAKAKKHECFLLRVDLIYSASTREVNNFGPPSHSRVRRDVAAFLETVRSDPNFTGATWKLSPYADLCGQWQLPLIGLIRGSDRSRPMVHHHLQKIWEFVADVKGKSLECNLLFFKGEYRFICHDQAMFDSLDQQILNAATYLFGTRMIADTDIDTVSTDIGPHAS